MHSFELPLRPCGERGAKKQNFLSGSNNNCRKICYNIYSKKSFYIKENRSNYV